MKYKIGEWIIYNNKKWKNYWKKTYGISLYGKIAKIIDISDSLYLIEFKEFIYSYDGDGKGKDGHCLWCRKKEITLYKDYFKLKKFIEGYTK